MTITLNAAPTGWATDTNYASGPADGTATKVDPGSGRFAQGWVPADTLPAQHLNFHLNAIGASLIDIVSKVSGKALDAVGGGSYTPTAPINFLGTQSINFHTFSVDSTGTLTVTPGGKVDVISGGNVEFNASEDLTIDDVLNTFQLTLTPQSISQSSGTPTWVGQNFGAGWLQSIVSSGFSIAFPINLPDGDTIISVTAGVNGGFNGGHSALPAGTDRLALELVRVSGTGAVTSLALRRDQSASVGVYDADHTVVLQNGALDSGSMPQVVDASFRYYVVVHGETGANAIANTTLLTSISGSCVATCYRSANMTY